METRVVNKINKTSDIKRKNFMRILIICQIIYLLVFNGTFASFPVLSKIRYLTDIVTIALAVGLFFDRKSLYKIKGKAYYIPLIVYSIVCVVTAIAYKTEPLLFLWAIRNTFRFFVFFFACIVYIEKKDIKSFFDFLIKLQVVNLPLMIVQYFYFKPFPKEEIGILPDRVSGVFGTEIGGNGSLNIYLCVVFIFILISFYETENVKISYILSIIDIMLCAALAELKIFFLEAVILFFICSFLYFREIKKSPMIFFCVLCLVAISIIIGMYLMLYIYPKAGTVYRDYGKYETNSVSVYRIGRIGAFSEINSLFFENSLEKRLFGLGFGNCEYSNFSFLISDFYQKYGEYNYRWFTHQMLYLETGAIGFISFASFFITMAIQALVFFHKQPNNRKVAVFSIALSAILLSNLWYNCIIRADFGYICYFCLAFTPILINNKIMKGRS